MITANILKSVHENELSPRGLQAAIEAVAAADLLLRTYANGLNSQPDIDLVKPAGLPTHQQALRKTIAIYFERLSPAIEQNYADLLAYCNEFKAFSLALQSFAQTVESSTATEQERSEAAKELLDGCSIFQRIIVEYQVTCAGTLTQATSLNRELTVNQEDSQSDLQTVEYSLNEVEIAKVQSQVNAQLDAIHKDNEQIAQGAVKAWKPMLKIILGVVKLVAKVLGGGGDKTEQTGLRSTNGDDAAQMLVEGIKEASHLNRELDGIVTDVNTRLVDYKNLLITLSIDQMRYASVLTLASRVNALVAASSESIEAITALGTAWQQLAENLTKLQSSMSDHLPIAGTYTLLLEATKEWIRLHEQMQQLQSLSTSPVEKNIFE